MKVLDELPARLEKHGVVGAQLAVLVDGEIHDATAGVLRAGVEVTPDAAFQLASVTKIWTATLVQESVNEGLLDLDRPVRDVLPGFRLADEDAAKSLTPRHLLCHVGGFDGNHFYDTGTGDDAVAKYVDRLAEATRVTAPGELFSYSNDGFVVLGRIVEVLRGQPFNAVVKERLVEPLGLRNVATTIGEAAELPAAVGHVDGKPATDSGPESDWPAGSALAMSARDLLTFIRMHLSTTAFDVMREPQVKPPDTGSGVEWGLGWVLYAYRGGQVIGHDGGNVGFNSYLRVVPEAGVAVALLTNGGDSAALYTDTCLELLRELAGVRPPDRPVPPAEPVRVDAKIAGTYRASGMDLVITPSGKGFRVRTVPHDAVSEQVTADPEREYVGLRQDALISVDEPHAVIVLAGENRLVHQGRVAVRA